MTHFLKPIVVRVALMGATTVGASAQESRVLTIPRNLCPATIESLTGWAETATAYGAFAMPTDPDLKRDDCESSKMVVPSGVSGFASIREARKAALADCEANRASDLGPCNVFGELKRR